MPVTATYSLDRVFSTTAEVIRPEIAREIARSNALTTHLFRQGAVRYQGGSDYRIPVNLVDNPNVSDLGPFTTFTTAPSDGPDSARYVHDDDGSVIRSSFVLSKTEMAKNKDKATQVVSLVQGKMAQAGDTLGARLSTELFTAKAGLAMKGLPDFLGAAAFGSQTGSPGGINKAVYTARWQNQYQQITTWANDGETKLAQAVLSASMSGSSPDIIVSGQEAYLLYENGLLPNQKDFDTRLADLGYTMVSFRGIPWVIDSALNGTDEIYVLTTTGKRVNAAFSLKPEFFKMPGKNPIAMNVQSVVGMHLVILPDHDFILEGPFDVSFQQRVLSWNMIFGGMLATGSLQRQALLNFAGGTAL